MRVEVRCEDGVGCEGGDDMRVEVGCVVRWYVWRVLTRSLLLHVQLLLS